MIIIMYLSKCYILSKHCSNMLILNMIIIKNITNIMTQIEAKHSFVLY